MISSTTPSPTVERQDGDGTRAERVVPEPLSRRALRQCALERQAIERRVPRRAAQGHHDGVFGGDPQADLSDASLGAGARPLPT
jgi:hypothetical protein